MAEIKGIYDCHRLQQGDSLVLYFLQIANHITESPNAGGLYDQILRLQATLNGHDGCIQVCTFCTADAPLRQIPYISIFFGRKHLLIHICASVFIFQYDKLLACPFDQFFDKCCLSGSKKSGNDQNLHSVSIL